MGNGTYAAEFETNVAGSAQVSVSLRGAPVGDSPFTVVVVPAELDATESRAQGSGLSGGNIRNSATFEFVVVATDRFGNRLLEGGAEVAVWAIAVGTDDRTEGSTTDNRDGSYAAKYTVANAGDFDVHVSINEVELRASPYRSEIVDEALGSESIPSWVFIASGGVAVLLAVVLGACIIIRKRRRLKTEA